MTNLEWIDAPSAHEATAAIREAFVSAHGFQPWGIFSAPGRVNLIGEHVDYNGGTVVPLALPHRTYVAVSPRADGVVRAASAQENGGAESVSLSQLTPGSLSGWLTYVAGVPWAMSQAGLAGGDDGQIAPGAEILVDSAVPLGAGLSSSAALECSVALAVDSLCTRDHPERDLLAATDEGRGRLAAACIRAENEIAGANTGGMDQSISLRAHEGSVLTIDCRDFSSRPISIDIAGAGLALLVIDTRAPHRLADGQYAHRRSGCDAAAKALDVPTLRDVLPEDITEADLSTAFETWENTLRRGEVVIPEGHDADSLTGLVRHVWTEVFRVEQCKTLFSSNVAAENPAWLRLGELLDASHASLRDDYQVSCPELDLAVDAAREAGALGARMTGGGFGGSAIALVRAEDVAAVASAVDQQFRAAGFNRPAFLEAVPSEAARRDV
ncbi:galactokinase [Kocuria sp. HSID16901]|uniref:galactokinase n=1 Tax=Kocuria sp. HSID16901 TaxID=2419505 RepID=UPI001EE960F7|nr:galactokinase [Kocuria sp. HSID16901]